MGIPRHSSIVTVSAEEEQEALTWLKMSWYCFSKSAPCTQRTAACHYQREADAHAALHAKMRSARQVCLLWQHAGARACLLA
jgi:hypothetical protein